MLKPFDQGPVVACGIRKISDGQFETLVRSLGLGDEQPATIIAHLCAMPQLWPIRRGIDQLILRLGRAQAMIINLLIIIGRLEGFSALWFRSEEHTSELQSLMRISYAVFCLKKKKQQRLSLHEIRHKRKTTSK